MPSGYDIHSERAVIRRDKNVLEKAVRLLNLSNKELQEIKRRDSLKNGYPSLGILQSKICKAENAQSFLFLLRCFCSFQHQFHTIDLVNFTGARIIIYG